MKTAQTGDTVKVHYTGKLADGTVFDTSNGRDPLEFQLGQGQMIPGFESAITGMQVGEDKVATLAPEMAYGEAREDLVFPYSRQNLPQDMEVQQGMQLNATVENGQQIQVMVADVKDDHIILDANHPLAGKALTFEIKLLEVNSPEDSSKKPLLYD